MFIKKSLLLTFIFLFLQLGTTNKSRSNQKQKKNKKVTFNDFYCLINTRFWITNEKNFIKKITFSDVYFFISHFISHKL